MHRVGVALVVLSLGCGDDGGSIAGDASSTIDAVVNGTDAAADATTNGCPAGMNDPSSQPSWPDCSTVSGATEVAVQGVMGDQAAFHDANGTVVCVSDADGAGLIQGPASSGGMVTVMRPDESQSYGNLLSIGGLASGDSISLLASFGGGTTDKPVEVSFPSVTNAVGYRLYAGGGCNAAFASSSPAMLNAGSACTGSDDAITILGVALDANNNALGWAWINDLPLAASGTTTATVAAWQTTGTNHTISLSNIHASVGQVQHQRSLVVDGLRYPCVFGSCSESLAVTSGSATSSFQLPTENASTVYYNVSMAQPSQEDGIDFVGRVVSPLPASSSIDVAADLLPHVVTASALCGSFRPVVTWSQSSSTVQADAIIALVDVENTETPRNWKWTLVMPPDATSPLAYPEVPIGLLPTAPRTISMEALTLLRSTAATSYTEVKANPLTIQKLAHLFMPLSAGFEVQESTLGDFDGFEL